MENKIVELKNLYFEKKKEIEKKLKEFKKNFESEEKIFYELCFCLLTPQSKARNCWKSIEYLKRKNLIFNGSEDDIKEALKNVRFRNKKAYYLVYTRNLFFKNKKLSIKPVIKSFKNLYDLREYLVKNIKGLGYKEASHFLRNIGFGNKIAILDRHILKNLKELKVIDKIPRSLNKNKYIEIEKKFIEFSYKIGIKPSELDLLLWAKETGFVFK
ncbi:MAG: N-glycosylase/DNA lyase [Candidatus Ratteibacteria bacterium]